MFTLFLHLQRIMSLKKYVENYERLWKYDLDFYLKRVGGKLLLQCNFDIGHYPLLFLPFTESVCKPGLL